MRLDESSQIPAAPRPSNSFTSLAGVPVRFDRLPPEYPYGSRGKAMTFYCTADFEAKLNVCFSDLWHLCPLGKPEVILSAGAWVDKPGMHGQGRGFDLDGFYWPAGIQSYGRVFIANKYPEDRPFYLAVEAVLHKHFGVVLDWHYNTAHHDHFHIDDTDEPSFSPQARSEVNFVQAVLTYILGLPVSITGDYTAATQTMVRDGLRDLEIIGTLADRRTWFAFLDAVAQMGFEAGIKKTPLELLHALYTTVDRGGSYQNIRKALNAFANHTETREWLARYR